MSAIFGNSIMMIISSKEQQGRNTNSSVNSPRSGHKKYIPFVLMGVAIVLMLYPSEKSKILLSRSVIGQSAASIVYIRDGQYHSTLLLGIFSCEGDKSAARRKIIRDTYLATGDPRICKLNDFIKQVLKAKGKPVRCQLPYTFVIGAGGENRPTDHGDKEAVHLKKNKYGKKDKSGDTTYLNIKENMEDGKSATWLKYGASLSKQLPIDYVAKIDDDSVLSSELLLDLMSDELPPAPFNRNIYGGKSWSSYIKSVLYAEGQFYFMSADLANWVGLQLSAAARLRKSHGRHTEDADMGVFVHSHPRPVKFMSLSKYKIWFHPKKKDESFIKAWKKIGSLPDTTGVVLPLGSMCKVWLQKRGMW